MTHRKRESQRRVPTQADKESDAGFSGEVSYLALNKNFLSEEGFVSVVDRAVVLYILLAFLALAKKQKTRRLSFRSNYAALRAIGLVGSKKDYDALKHTLKFWKENGFIFKSWFKGHKKPPGYIKGEQNKRRVYRKREKEAHESRRFKRVWHTWKSRKVEGKFLIEFDQDFWDANIKKYFCPTHISTLKRLLLNGNIQILLLYLVLASWDFKLNRQAGNIAAVIGLKERQPVRRLQILKRMVEKISVATGKPLDFLPKDNGVVLIKAPGKGREIAPYTPPTAGEKKRAQDQGHEQDLADDWQ